MKLRKDVTQIIRIIMAVAGMLLICLGGSGIGIGMLLLLPGVITVLKAIYRKRKDKQRRERMAAEEKERKLAEEKRKREAIEEQRRLFARFKNSSVTQDVINTICDRNPSVNLPEKIEVFHDRIQANLNGQMFTYSFAANRVHSFQQVITTVFNRGELQYVVRPQIAMAEALNALFDNKYQMRDQAEERYNEYEDYTSITYISRSVVLILKSTLPNRSF